MADLKRQYTFETFKIKTLKPGRASYEEPPELSEGSKPFAVPIPEAKQERTITDKEWDALLSSRALEDNTVPGFFELSAYPRGPHSKFQPQGNLAQPPTPADHKRFNKIDQVRAHPSTTAEKDFDFERAFNSDMAKTLKCRPPKSKPLLKPPPKVDGLPCYAQRSGRRQTSKAVAGAATTRSKITKKTAKVNKTQVPMKTTGAKKVMLRLKHLQTKNGDDPSAGGVARSQQQFEKIKLRVNFKLARILVFKQTERGNCIIGFKLRRRDSAHAT